MEDIAKKAKVAKGTVYLYFPDKDTLFEQIVKTRISPVISALEVKADPNKPLRQQIEEILLTMAQKIVEPTTSSVIKLLISEGQRFPHLSEMYYQLVVKRGMAALTSLLIQQQEDSPRIQRLAKFPQLLVAPALTGMIWKNLFEPYQKLNLPEMLTTYLDILFSENTDSPRRFEP